MYCSNCGNEIKLGSSFCGNCGKKIESNNNLQSNKIDNNNNFNVGISSVSNNNVVVENNFNNNGNSSFNNFNNGMMNQNNNFNNRKIDTDSKRKMLIIILVIVICILLIVGLCLGIKKFQPNSNKSNMSGSGVDSEQLVENEVVVHGNELKTTTGTRTIMIYLIGSDLESSQGSASKDIEEMLGSDFNTSDVNILVYAGGTTHWRNSTFNSKENAIYEVDGKKIEKVKAYDLKKMTNPETLTEFIDYVYKNYESDLYGLILWDHGGGPLYGYGLDENDKTKDSMSLVEIDKALKDSQLIEETKFEFIGFDACLMSSIEIANMFKEEANYLIASSDVEPGDGWDYDFLGEIDSSTTSEELGKQIIDYYYNYYQVLSSYYGYDYNPEITLSLIDLRSIDSLIKSVDDLFGEVDSSITVNTYSKISRGASRAVMYGYNDNSATQYDLVDLYDLVEELGDYDGKSSRVQSKIKDIVIYEKGTIEDCYGMSIYFPVTTKSMYNRYKSVYDDIIVSEKYEEFLDKYINIGTGDRLVKSNMQDIMPITSDSGISAQLPKDIAENYQTADYIVFKKMEDGSFLPIYKSQDVEIKGTTIRATVANRRISVSDVNGKNIEDIIAIESSRDKNSVTYVLSAVLQYWDDNDFVGSFKVDSVQIYLRVDNKTGQGEIIDIKPIQSSEELVGKVTYNLNDWTVMDFVSSSYILYDENGNKLSEWKKTDTMYGTEVDIQEGYKFLASSLDETEEYYYMFRVRDTQGNLYETNLVKAK